MSKNQTRLNVVECVDPTVFFLFLDHFLFTTVAPVYALLVLMHYIMTGFIHQ